MCSALIRTKMYSNSEYSNIGTYAKSGRPYRKGDRNIPIASASSSFYYLFILISSPHCFLARPKITLVSTPIDRYFIHIFFCRIFISNFPDLCSVESTIGNLYYDDGRRSTVDGQKYISSHRRHWIFKLSVRPRWNRIYTSFGFFFFERVTNRTEISFHFPHWIFFQLDFLFWMENNKMFKLMAFPYLSCFFLGLLKIPFTHFFFYHTIQKRKFYNFRKCRTYARLCPLAVTNFSFTGIFTWIRKISWFR